MTTLEARVTALEQDVTVLLLAIQQISVTQTLYTSICTTQMRDMTERIKRLVDDMRGESWETGDDE